MRKDQIRPGVIYAWQDTKNSRPRPIMFLVSPSKDEYPLWERSWRERDEMGKAVFTPCTRTSARPYASISFNANDIGYPAVMAKSASDEHIEQALPLLPEAALERYAKLAGTATDDGPVMWTLITSLRRVTGLWDEVHAEWQRQRDEEQAARLAREKETQERIESGQRLVDRLDNVGVIVQHSFGLWSGKDEITISREELEKLAGQLEHPGTAPETSVLTVLATPAELMGAATGEAVAVHTDDPATIVRLRIPEREEYREIMRQARARMAERGMTLPPEPTDTQVDRVLRPLQATQG
jgi:hypothetical protein